MIPVIVERRDVDSVVVHGSIAGLLAGVALGATAMVGSIGLGGSGGTPFRFASAFVVGPEAFRPDFPLVSAILLGGSIHFVLAALFGIVFVGLLALTYQLSARPWLLIIYGSLFAFGVWEIDFLAAVPTFFPYLVGRLDVATQLWTGIVSYALIYGPVLGLYVALVRPGVVDDWHAVGPPAGTFPPSSSQRRGS